MTNTQTEKEFIIMNVQDTCDWWYSDLEAGKDFLRNNWTDDDYETHEEMLRHQEEIRIADEEELGEMLEGIGYLIFETEEEILEWRKEVGLE